MGRVMSSVSRTVSGQTPMRGMIEEQSVQSASVKGSMLSSESVIDASIMSSVPSVKGGSESPGMSELADRRPYPPPRIPTWIVRGRRPLAVFECPTDDPRRSRGVNAKGPAEIAP